MASYRELRQRGSFGSSMQPGFGPPWGHPADWTGTLRADRPLPGTGCLGAPRPCHPGGGSQLGWARLRDWGQAIGQTATWTEKWPWQYIPSPSAAVHFPCCPLQLGPAWEASEPSSASLHPLGISLPHQHRTALQAQPCQPELIAEKQPSTKLAPGGSQIPAAGPHPAHPSTCSAAIAPVDPGPGLPIIPPNLFHPAYDSVGIMECAQDRQLGVGLRLPRQSSYVQAGGALARRPRVPSQAPLHGRYSSPQTSSRPGQPGAGGWASLAQHRPSRSHRLRTLRGRAEVSPARKSARAGTRVPEAGSPSNRPPEHLKQAVAERRSQPPAPGSRMSCTPPQLPPDQESWQPESEPSQSRPRLPLGRAQ